MVCWLKRRSGASLKLLSLAVDGLLGHSCRHRRFEILKLRWHELPPYATNERANPRTHIILRILSVLLVILFPFSLFPVLFDYELDSFPFLFLVTAFVVRRLLQ